MLICVHERLPISPGNTDWDNFVGKNSAMLSRNRPLMRSQREFILRLPGYLVLTTKVFGRLQHAAFNWVIHASRCHATASNSVVHRHVFRTGSPAHGRGVILSLAH